MSTWCSAPKSRGFILGAALAYALGAGFVCARKPGKLPWKTVAAEYELEYGTDKLEVHEDAIAPGMNVLVHDDLLATGGTADAKCELVERLGGTVVGVAFLVELVRPQRSRQAQAATTSSASFATDTAGVHLFASGTALTNPCPGCGGPCPSTTRRQLHSGRTFPIAMAPVTAR